MALLRATFSICPPLKEYPSASCRAASFVIPGCFGIVVDEDVPVETVRLKVDSNQRPYFESRKLHWSQREVERHDTWSVFEYRMAPTWDLAMDLLQYHGQVEVLVPGSLRDLVVDYAYGILARYGENPS